jgi:hypothetical protein
MSTLSGSGSGLGILILIQDDQNTEVPKKRKKRRNFMSNLSSLLLEASPGASFVGGVIIIYLHKFLEVIKTVLVCS